MSELPKLPEETPEQRLEILADRYQNMARKFCQASYAKTIVLTREERAKLHNEMYKINERIPFFTRRRIMNEELKDALRLPESLYISPKAMSRLEHTLERYTFESLKWGDFSDELREELMARFEEADIWLKSEPLQGVSYMLAREKGRVVGMSAFDQENVHYQVAEKENAGIGLGMIQKIIKEVKEEGSTSLNLGTAKIPRGLGNLGFEFNDEAGRTFPQYINRFDQT